MCCRVRARRAPSVLIRTRFDRRGEPGDPALRRVATDDTDERTSRASTRARRAPLPPPTRARIDFEHRVLSRRPRVVLAARRAQPAPWSLQVDASPNDGASGGSRRRTWGTRNGPSWSKENGGSVWELEPPAGVTPAAGPWAGTAARIGSRVATFDRSSEHEGPVSLRHASGGRSREASFFRVGALPPEGQLGVRGVRGRRHPGDAAGRRGLRRPDVPSTARASGNGLTLTAWSSGPGRSDTRAPGPPSRAPGAEITDDASSDSSRRGRHPNLARRTVPKQEQTPCLSASRGPAEPRPLARSRIA